SPVASLATTKEGLRVNARRGDQLRQRMYQMTERVLAALAKLGIATPNCSGYPIIEIPLVNPNDIDEVGRHLFERGIYVTMAAYPLVPHREVGFRVQITAANTDEQIDSLIEALQSLTDRFQIQSEMPLLRRVFS